jgi:hypothetical protein
MVVALKNKKISASAGFYNFNNAHESGLLFVYLLCSTHYVLLRFTYKSDVRVVD